MCRKENDKSSYYPAFLCMDVNAQESLDNICIWPLEHQTEALFLHEYVHYLQDMTTVSGYARISTIDDRIKYAAGKIARSSKLAIPIDVRETYSYNIRPNAENMEIFRGDFSVKNSQGCRIDISIGDVECFSLQDRFVYEGNGIRRLQPIETVMRFRSGGMLYQYRVGEYAISESMAYLIESTIYPSALPPATDCPYRVVEKLVEYKLGHSIGSESIVALCDVCLMYTFPGVILYEMLNFLASYQGVICPALIYMYGMGPNIMKLYPAEKTWDTLFVHQLQHARAQIRDMFNHDAWLGLRQVVVRVFDEAKEIRINKIPFFIDIMRGGKLCENVALRQIMERVGCLSFKSLDNKLYYIKPQWCHLPELDSDWFVSLRSVYEILYTNSAVSYHKRIRQYMVGTKCSLMDWCHHNFNQRGRFDLTTSSENCTMAPWRNIRPEEVADCPFTRIWTAYGFTNVKLLANKHYLDSRSGIGK